MGYEVETISVDGRTTALGAAGFLIARMEEPRPSGEAIKRMHRQFADYLRVPNFLIVEALRPAK